MFKVSITSLIKYFLQMRFPVRWDRNCFSLMQIIASLSILVAVAHSFPKKEAEVYAYIKPAAPVLLEKEIEVKGKYVSIESNPTL